MANKILIIDDNEDIRDIYTLFLEQKGYEVISAEDGLKGCALAAEHKPQAILLDIMMPQMDGFEVLESLKKSSSLESKIIVVSNLSQQREVDRMFQMGANGYLVKSNYSPDQLVQEIEKILHAPSQKAKITKQKADSDPESQIQFPDSVKERFTIEGLRSKDGKEIYILREK